MPPRPADDEDKMESGFETPINRGHGRRTSGTDPVSPSLTVDTAIGDSPTAAATPMSNLTINHNISTFDSKVKGKSAKGAAPRAVGGIVGLVATKPGLAIMAIVVLVALTAASGGAAAWLRFFRIPGLESQVDRLEEEVDRLSGQVDRLEKENDRFEKLNNQLNATVEELEEITDDLEEIKDDLNTTNVELQVRVIELAAENELYQRLNQDLNATASRLSDEVDQFQDALVILQLEKEALSNVTERLTDLTFTLTNQTEAQEAALLQLQESLEDIRFENERLLTLTTNLQRIATFLDSTSIGLNSSLTQVTEVLANQIVANQAIVLLGVETSYRNRLIRWDCDYRIAFGGQEFGQDFTVTIPDTAWPEVLNYVDDRVLADLCLDPTDLDQYLSEDLYSAFPAGISTDQLMRGVLFYVERAMDYYFPETIEGDTIALSPVDWAEASYACGNLPPFRLYGDDTTV